MDEENLVIHRIFSNAVSKFPGKAALQLKKNTHWQKFTYKELEAFSLKIAAFLIKEGFRKNDFAALVLENRPEWAIIYLGIMYAGLTCVPLDPQLSREEIKNFVFDSGARVIFCSLDIFTQKINQDIKGRLDKIILLDAQYAEDKNIINFSVLENIRPDTAILPAVLPEDIASLVYTSGTTAQSKGVLLTHKNICSNFRSIEKINIVFPSDNFLSILPLYHSYAFMATLILPLLSGARVTYFPVTFKPQDISAIIKEGGVTILAGVPQLFSLLHKAISDKIKKIPFFLLFIILPFIKSALRRRMGKSLRLLVSGGARLEPELGRHLSGLLGVKLIEGYGLTETSPIATINPPQKIKFGSAGKSIPGVQIKISRADKSGVGEVLIKGANVMSGYFKHPEWTAQVIREGWFYSGDLGYIDKEGYLFLTGREKDVIVLSSGKNIYPQELEEYYGRSPYIKELCILSKSEERFSRKIESLYAVVVPDLDYFHQRNERDIQGKVRWELENLAKELPSYKHIMGFMISKEELPRTALKKIKRYQVKKKFLEGKSWEVEAKETVLTQEDADILNRDIAKKITAYISSEVKKPVYLNSHLELDLGIDSLSRVELGLGLEALFSVKIPEDVLYSVSTVKEVIARISEITAGALLLKKQGKLQRRAGPIS